MAALSVTPEGLRGAAVTGAAIAVVVDMGGVLSEWVLYHPMQTSVALCFLAAAASFNKWRDVATPSGIAAVVMTAAALFPASMGTNSAQARIRKNLSVEVSEAKADISFVIGGVERLVLQAPEPTPRQPFDPW